MLKISAPPRLRILAITTALALCATTAPSQQRAAKKAGVRADPIGITPEMRIVTNHISANSLRGHVSFLASDLLEGRDTPSRGLDIAAEYIVSEFRRMGLEPVTGDSYLQPVPIAGRPAKGNMPATIAGTANNIVGVLRGSDPTLKDTYVIISSHYDHLGLAATDDKRVTGDDRIFNGANDDASGTASVLEVANALASLHPRPTPQCTRHCFLRGGKRTRRFALLCRASSGAAPKDNRAD